MMRKVKNKSDYDVFIRLMDAIADSDLNSRQAAILIAIFSFYDNGLCVASIDDISKFSKIAPKTIKQHIERLIELNWLMCEYTATDTNVYIIKPIR